MMNKIFNNKHPERKKIAILIDPDKQSNGRLAGIIEKAKANDVDYIFVGGSLITNNNLDSCIETIKSNCEIPVILFPGHVSQISKHADATLFLSLISGRNADLLIGQQVIAAPLLKEVGTKILPTGYMIIESGGTTSASYMSQTQAIPYNKHDIAACTALAGEMLGLQHIFIDAGSGADKPVSPEMIRRVRKEVSLPIIIGGGIKTEAQALDAIAAGADIIVIGNAFEKDPELIASITKSVHKFEA